MARRQLSIRTRFLMGLIVAFSLLGLAEVGARLSGLQPAYSPDATGSWRTIPNLVGHQMVGMREPHEFKISTDAEGLRTPLTKTKGDDITRIAVMGDSTVFGWGVEDGESVGDFAQAALVSAGYTQVEILNAGQPGYSTGMAAWLFEEAVAAYTPDWTIVFVSMHDFNRTLISDVERVHGPQSLSARWRSFLARDVALYEGLRRLIYPFADKAQIMPSQETSEMRVPRVSDVERTASLGRMQRIAQAWGGSVSVGFLPFYADLMEGPRGRSIERPGIEHGKDWAASRNVPMFDLRKCCGPGADALTFPFDHGHLNAAGNREAGEALARQIIEHLFRQNE